MRNIYRNAYSYRAAGSDSELEALQTDIMRFMAILGFCLMVIFALVQAIPPSSNASQLIIEETLVSQVEALKQEAEELSQQVEKNRKTLRKQKRVLEEVKQTSAHVINNLDEINRSLKQEQHSLAQVRRQVGREQARLHDAKIKFQTMQKIAESTSNPRREKEQQGFSLNFASDTTLLKLIASKKVELYFLNKKQTYKVLVRQQHARFIKSKPPVRVYDMAPQTLPKMIRQQFKKAFPGHADQSVRWGVVLNSGMENQIRRLMRENKGGSLEIQDHGAVVFLSKG